VPGGLNKIKRGCCKTSLAKEKPKRILHSKKKKSGSEISGTGQNACCKKKNKKNRKKNENYTSAPNPCPVLTGALSGGNAVKSFGVRQPCKRSGLRVLA
jgi:hypothetical protein